MEWVQERIGELEPVGVSDFFEEFYCKEEERNRVETRDGYEVKRGCVWGCVCVDR